jgi:hypothetical protein
MKKKGQEGEKGWRKGKWRGRREEDADAEGRGMFVPRIIPLPPLTPKCRCAFPSLPHRPEKSKR